jgi:hypothetical protein
MFSPTPNSVCDRKGNSASILCANSAYEKRIFTTCRPLWPGSSLADIVKRDANCFVYGRIEVVGMFFGIEAASLG